VDYEWDEAKSETTRRERGLPFEVAVLLFDRPVLVTVDDRFDYGETRLRAVGEVEGVILPCVFTETHEVRRIISLRRANRRERDGYRSTYPG
jgi:uncharacterized DUF497 family protein